MDLTKQVYLNDSTAIIKVEFLFLLFNELGIKTKEPTLSVLNRKLSNKGLIWRFHPYLAQNNFDAIVIDIIPKCWLRKKDYDFINDIAKYIIDGTFILLEIDFADFKILFNNREVSFKVARYDIFECEYKWFDFDASNLK